MPIADFLARAPEAPTFVMIRSAVQLLKVGESSSAPLLVNFVSLGAQDTLTGIAY